MFRLALSWSPGGDGGEAEAGCAFVQRFSDLAANRTEPADADGKNLAHDVLSPLGSTTTVPNFSPASAASWAATISSNGKAAANGAEGVWLVLDPA